MIGGDENEVMMDLLLVYLAVDLFAIFKTSFLIEHRKAAGLHSHSFASPLSFAIVDRWAAGGRAFALADRPTYSTTVMLHGMLPLYDIFFDFSFLLEIVPHEFSGSRTRRSCRTDDDDDIGRW